MLLLLEVGGHRQGLLERRVLLLLLLLCSETDCRRLPRSAATVRPGVMHEAARREAHARGETLPLPPVCRLMLLLLQVRGLGEAWGRP